MKKVLERTLEKFDIIQEEFGKGDNTLPQEVARIMWDILK